jgi:2-polyprenyl-6-methoxyphenol hydroxylase-like FAD-dependent oxidoreductase
MFDAIVVGARCAGAAAAMLLARRGHRVALIDRATFPSDTLSTHFMWQRGAARLQAWGLLERLRSRGCEPIPELTLDLGPVVLSGSGPPVDGVVDTYCPKRSVLDSVLVDAAVEAGAELFEACSVDELDWCEGRAAGVRGRRRTGASLRLSGRLIIGADGLHSTIAARVGAAPYRWHAPRTCVYYAYWSGIKPRQASFHSRPGRLILVWPTNDEQTCIYVAWPHHEFRLLREDIERQFLTALALVPGLPDRVAAGDRQTRFFGTADLPNQYRVSHGPGWALVGDAGHHKDPSTGMGITDAFVSAELLVDAVDARLLARDNFDEVLTGYAGRRDAVTANGFALTLRTAALQPISEHMLRFYAYVAEHPDQTTRVLGAMGGAIPFEEVYSRYRIADVLD